MNATDRAGYTKGLRALADLTDAHPDLPLPYITAHSSCNTAAYWYLHINALEDDLPAQKATAAGIIRALGGKWDKKDRLYDNALELNQDRNGIALQVVVARSAVCERVVVGTREVTVPARPAVKATKATTTVVEDVEWVCSSLLSEDEPTPFAVVGDGYGPREESDEDAERAAEPVSS